MPHLKIAFFWTVLTTVAGFSTSAHAQKSQVDPSAEDRILIRSIFDEVLAHGEAHEQLRVLCKDIGHRLSGSRSADRAMVWGRETMDAYGADTTYIMPVEVPAWTRGNLAEAGAILDDGAAMPLRITALGGSVPTPDDQWVKAAFGGRTLMPSTLWTHAATLCCSTAPWIRCSSTQEPRTEVRLTIVAAAHRLRPKREPSVCWFVHSPTRWTPCLTQDPCATMTPNPKSQPLPSLRWTPPPWPS